jgi:hypothetical protein
MQSCEQNVCALPRDEIVIASLPATNDPQAEQRTISALA